MQLALKMEDERTQHPLVRVAAVDPAPLATLVAALPRLRLVLLNGPGGLGHESLRRLAGAGQVYFDIAMLEGVGGIANLLPAVPAARLLFGSHYPFFYFEAALLKLRESGLEAAQERAIRRENALTLLKKI